MISKKLQEVLEDHFGMDIDEIDEDFNPDHPFFSVCRWPNGQSFSSHEDMNSIRELVAEAASRRYDDSFDYCIFDRQGNRLWPNFSTVTFERMN